MKVMNPERLETALLLTTLEDWAAESGTTVDEVGEMIVTTVLRWFGRQVEQVWGYPPEGAHLRLLGMTEPDIIPVELLNRKGERINIWVMSDFKCDSSKTDIGERIAGSFECRGCPDYDVRTEAQRWLVILRPQSERSYTV